MKNPMKSVCTLGAPMFAAFALLLSGPLMGAGCDSAGEAIDNWDSRVACGHYCTKKFDCQDHTPSGSESDACVSGCRSAIEDECGNEHQATANDRIEECVDNGCAEFWGCMVFDAAPECYGFVDPQ